ncbi:hypothetical protein [Erwinia phyllosphaerae]|uniref:hypothetical protein n=1 Tax=Erwinia phyllosphaerae TaxID=2853256 RepID=UPI001FED54AA|nr:hypothetical protein [Erwinia phyllosphaerae]MBV4366248.1 hypothetical protein [Erwinia phyllosphaerae]
MNFKFSRDELERMKKTDSAKPGDVTALAQIVLNMLAVKPVGEVIADEPLFPGDKPVCSPSLYRSLPAGTALYIRPPAPKR